MNERRAAVRGSPPDRKTVALVLVGFVALLGAYLLGRASPPPIERVSPEPMLEPSTFAPGDPALAPPSELVADLRGAGTVLAEVTFSDRRRALILCRPVGTPARDRLTVSLLDSTAEPNRLLAHDEILKSVRCADCQIDVVELVGEQIGLGTCPTVINRGAFEPSRASSMSFVVAEPPPGIASPIGLVVDCGVTSLVLDDDELALDGRKPTADGQRQIAYPPVRFDRRGQRFYADDLPVMRHFCDGTGSRQLSGFLESDERWFVEYRDLAYMETYSNIGTIGIRRQVLVAITPEQCGTLSELQRRPLASDETERPLAELTGLEPTDGADDWYLTCRLE